MIGQIGLSIGNITIIAEGRITYNGKARKRLRHWLCRCICGKTLEVSEKRLKYGSGCAGCARLAGKNAHYLHGESKKTPEHRAWTAMKTRCYNPNFHEYAAYGGRGIAVCDRWRDSFANFLIDMGRKPSPSHTLDRWPNKDGNYEPGNCRWATDSEQRRNRRTNVNLTMDGRTMCVADWAAELGIRRQKILYRLHAGWPIEEVLKGK